MARIQNITDLREPPIVGRFYLVPTIRYWWADKFADWPVNGPLHHDKDINFPALHYHVDARFLTKRQRKHANYAYNIANIPRYNSHPISEAQQFCYLRLWGPIPRQPTYLKRQCTSLDYDWKAPTLPRPESPSWLKYNPAVAIHRPDGRILCPHRKVDLSQFTADENGFVTCPLHGLKVRCFYPEKGAT